MKKLFLLVVAVAMIGMYSCTKDNDGTSSGSEVGGIAGMGDRVAEDVEIANKFLLPEGVELVGAVTGVAPVNANLKSASTTDALGLGGQFITVVMEFLNNSQNAQQIVFEPGLIFQLAEDQGVDINAFQRGIVLTQMIVNLDNVAGTTKVTLNLFCVNEGFEGSAIGIEYEIVGTTSDPQLLSLIGFINNTPVGEFNGDEDDVQFITNPAYLATLTPAEQEDLIVALQELIWWITDNTHPYAYTKEQIQAKINEVLGTL
ncbi:hypothetical protein [Saccharicrinis aurantiacus]|uniref:hypothetical protein n=1 Tax=Saccharicrinis aurantiacus TaxID=1849719 RepID=UPI002492249E|nr:hypothetical protein [Saccharicrinis aurantiacus]